MRAIDAERFDVLTYNDIDGVDMNSFKLGVEFVLDKIYSSPTVNIVPQACKYCICHPLNGGSGICHCTLGNQLIWS